MKPAIVLAFILLTSIGFPQDKPRPIELDPAKVQKRFEVLEAEKKKCDELAAYYTRRSHTIEGQIAELQNVVIDKSLAPADTAKLAKPVK